MIPGEYQIAKGNIALNQGRETCTIVVENHGDRPIQVGSHYHFSEVNPALRFDRRAARGFRLTFLRARRYVLSRDKNAKSNWCASLAHKGSWVFAAK